MPYKRKWRNGITKSGLFDNLRILSMNESDRTSKTIDKSSDSKFYNRTF